MEKISAAEIDGLLISSASALRTQADRIAELEAQLAERDRADHAEKIAHTAIERGIMAEEEAEDYVKNLVEGGQDLSVVEDIVSRAASGLPLGTVLDKTASDTSSDEEGDVLTNFLLTSTLG